MADIVGALQTIGPDGYPFNNVDLTTGGALNPGLDGLPFAQPVADTEITAAAAVDPMPVTVMSSHLPQWFEINVGDDATQTIYYGAFSAFCEALSSMRFPTTVVEASLWLTPQSRAYPRTLWRCPVRRQALERIGVVKLLVPGGDGPIALRQAISPADFLLTSEPVFAPSEDGFIYLRNIAQITETLISEDGTYQLGATDLIGDEEVWIDIGSRWERLSTAPDTFDYDTGILVGLDPGVICVKYSTISRMSAGSQPCIYVDAEPPVAPVPLDAWNSHDEAAMLASLTRDAHEDNASLDARIRVAYTLALAPGIDAFTASVGHELGLVGVISWDSSSDLDLAAAGIDDVSYAWALELAPESAALREILIPDGSNRTFTSARKLWHDDWKVYISGTRVTNRTRPDMVVHDGIVEFGSEVLGTVSATYRYANYDLQLAGGAIIQANANTPPGIYSVVYVRGVTAYAASSRGALEKLTTEAGQSTELYSALMSAAAAAVPVIIGSTNWGRSSHWFDDDEVAPQISHLPVQLQ